MNDNRLLAQHRECDPRSHNGAGVRVEVSRLICVCLFKACQASLATAKAKLRPTSHWRPGSESDPGTPEIVARVPRARISNIVEHRSSKPHTMES